MSRDELKDLIARAEHAASAGDIQGAIYLYQSSPAATQDLRVAQRLGDLYLAIGDEQTTADQYADVLKRLIARRQYLDATSVAKKLLKLRPLQVDLYVTLAKLYSSLGRNAEAAAQLRLLTEHYRSQGNWQAAAGAEDQATALARKRHWWDLFIPRNRPDRTASAGRNAGLSVRGVPVVHVPSDMQVFLCHASEDKPRVLELNLRLRADGYRTWLDEDDLLPGQDWETEIKKALRRSHVVAICLTRRALTKAGFVQKEIRLALDVLDEQPEGTIFIVPTRLENCEVPLRLRHLHYVDLFASTGYVKLRRALDLRARQLGFVSGHHGA